MADTQEIKCPKCNEAMADGKCLYCGAEEPDKQAENRQKLHQFKPGQSGNPAGRPKGRTIKEEIKKYLEDFPDEKDKFIMDLIKKYQPLTWQMLEGRPAQQVDLGNAGELPFIVKIVKDDRGTTETAGVGG